jgi:hypothetical protein
MRKKTIGTFFSLVVCIAFAVTPALAQATPAFMIHSGNELEEMEVGSKIVLYSSNFNFTTSGPTPKCEESELIFEVTENPGASAELIESRFGGEEAAEFLCALSPSSGFYFDLQNFEISSLELSSGGHLTLNDAAFEMEIFHQEGGKMKYTRTCGYDAGDIGMSSAFPLGGELSLDGFTPTLVSNSGTPGCFANMYGSGEFVAVNFEGNPVALAG